MKILHTSDIHLGEFPGPERGGMNCRLQDTLRCMDFLSEKAEEEKPDAILIAGDLFHRSKLWADEMLYEVRSAIDWILKLSGIAPVCLLYGTPNHDNAEAFKTLRKVLPANVYIFTGPAMQLVETKSGIIQVCALPGFSRGYFRAQNPGVSQEEENQAFTDALGKMVLELKGMCKSEYLSILMAHYTVPGANMESGQTQLFAQTEPMLLPETLDAAGFDLVALGHIHRPQKLEMCKNTYYSGAINAFNFNDEGQERGFWLHEPSESGGRQAFIKTPYREFITLKFTDMDMVGINSGSLDALAEKFWGQDDAVRGRIVRVLYTCSEETGKAFNRALLEKRLYNDGAFWVSEITPAKITAKVNRDQLTAHNTPEDNLRHYLLEKACPSDKIASVIEAARPIMDEASANNIVAGLNGVFEPLAIEVKNYRNYTEENFDFRPVSFCTINGANGSGKSSLFMDAILDCLFEEPREGDLTGWIRNAPDARSGSICFTFRIGEKTFRVFRSRAKSGKAALSLSEMVDTGWISRSKEKIRDTQDEIVNLLGMDSLTFRSCALIMQDGYGLFLEADKESRMSILGNIFGLGIYSDMENIARSRATELGREIRELNLKIEVLSDAVKNTGEIELFIATHQQQIEKLTAESKQVALVINNLKLRLANKQDAAARAAKLRGGIQSLAQKKDTIKSNLKAQRSALADAEQVLLEENEIFDGVAIYHSLLEEEKNLLACKAVYDAKKQESDTAYAEIQRLIRQMETARSEESSLLSKIAAINARLEKQEELAVTAAEYKAEKEQLALLEAAGEKWLFLNNERAGLIRKHSSLQAAYEGEYATRTGRVNELKDKARLLADSGCIDPDNANCAFLKDAQAAKAQMASYCDEYGEWQKTELAKIREFEAEIKTKDGEILLLGYDAAEAAKMRRLVVSLEQAAMDYESIQGYAAQAGLISDRLAALKTGMTEISDVLLPQAEQNYQAILRELNILQDADCAYATLQNRITLEKQWLEKEKQIPLAKERKNTAIGRISELEQEIGLFDAEIAQQQTELVKEEDAAYGCEILVDELAEAERRIVAHNEELKSHYGEMGALQKQLDQNRKTRNAVQEMQNILRQTSEKAAVMEELKIAFSQEGIPHNIIRAIIPALTATANNILAQMTAGRMGMEFVTEKTLKSNNKKEVVTLDVFIEEYGKGRLPYLSKSGGEKVKSALSAILALAEIKSSRAGIQMGMLFIDEPPFLDGDGIQAYCDALETIRRRYGNLKIMAITHDPSMKARFPQSLDVIKTDDGSKVSYE